MSESTTQPTSPLPEIDHGDPSAPNALKRAAHPAAKVIGQCVQHPETAVTRRCDRCRAPMCGVCDFTFPGGIHVCPACVASPDHAVSGKRIGLAIAGIAAACVSVAFLGLIMAGVMQFATEQAAGYAFVGLIMLPAAIGISLSYSAMDRNRGNSALLWISSGLSSLQLAVVVTMLVIGFTRGG